MDGPINEELKVHRLENLLLRMIRECLCRWEHGVFIVTNKTTVSFRRRCAAQSVKKKINILSKN